ncbi:hypothetical protein [Bacillus sp. B1-b2]|uniref:hypothetical protein n=1 Tax=Bacillus sp. B1-b2 TaxID=2653201 RepID=UPI001D02F043|nr:hypothetical protein [Bacillus sp. B1-b2]
MRKFIVFLLSGFVLFLLGIILSTLLDEIWVALGTIFAIIGGFMMGGSSYFYINKNK